MGSQVINHDEGRVEIWAPRSDVVLTRLSGRLNIEHARAVMAAVDGAIVEHPGQVIALHDWMQVESYELAVQIQMSSWSIRVMPHMRRVVVGVVSPLVALAVRTANLAVGHRLEVVRDRVSFEAEVRETLGHDVA